jgi:hypothetical protein
LRDIEQLDLETAWERWDALKKKAAYPTPTARQQSARAASRAAKTAADTAIAASKALTSTAAAAVTDQAAVPPVRTNPSRMVEIVKETATHYIIQWSQPEGNPARTKLLKTKKPTVEELELICAWDSRNDPSVDSVDLTSSG